ncbi:hypothetical protein SOVF_211940 [Spinacia oleracea]|nr:hypothetical protein SOVF_211940 [Spinacia oleracea]
MMAISLIATGHRKIHRGHSDCHLAAAAYRDSRIAAAS